MKKIFFKFFLSLIIFINACSFFKSDDEEMEDTLSWASKVPEWVSRTPLKKDAICAVGISEPTFFKDDSRKYAGENARKELARTLSLEMKSIMVDISSKDGSYVDDATITSISSWATSMVLKKSKIEEYWYDENGIASDGKKDITYALACMPLEIQQMEVEQKLLEPLQGAKSKEDAKGRVEEIIERLKERSNR